MSSKAEEAKIKGVLQTFLKSPGSIASYEELSQTITFEKLILMLYNETLKPSMHENVIKAIEKCFAFQSLRYKILRDEQMHDKLHYAASSQVKEIQGLVAKALELTSREVEGREILENPNLLTTLISLLTTEFLEVFQSVEDALLKIVQNRSEAFNLIFHNLEMENIFISLNTFDEVTLIRLLSFFISIGKTSPENFDLIEEKGVYKKVPQLILAKDVIIQMNSVELVNQLISFPKGLDFMCGENFPDGYLRELKLNDFEPVTTCLMHFLSESIEKLPQFTTKIFEGHSGIFVHKLREYFSLGIPKQGGSKLMCFIICWSHINTNPLGFRYLNHSMSTANSIVAEFLSGEKGREITLSCLSAWINVLQNANSEVISLLKDVVENELIGQAMALLLSNPLRELRGMVYHLLQLMLQKYPIFSEIFFNSKEHRNVLLDSTSDIDSQVKYAKYDFVKISMSRYSSTIEECAGKAYVYILDEYIKSGPFYRSKGLSTSIKDTFL